MQRGVAKGLQVPCLFIITDEYTLSKKPGGWYTPYTRVYPPIHDCIQHHSHSSTVMQQNWESTRLSSQNFDITYLKTLLSTYLDLH